MTGVGFAILFLVFALGVPFLLYRLLDVEDPDHRRATSWDDARARARNDGPRSGRRDRDPSDRDDATDQATRGDDDRGVDGNHWG